MKLMWKKEIKKMLEEIDNKTISSSSEKERKRLLAGKTGLVRLYNNLLTIEDLVKQGKVGKIKSTVDNNYLIISLYNLQKRRFKEFRIRRNASFFEEKRKIVEKFLQDLAKNFLIEIESKEIYYPT